MPKATLADHFTSFIELLVELKKDVNNRHNYKVKEITKDSRDNTALLIQIFGKEKPLLCFPSEIAEHEGFLNGFSNTDIRTIIYHATKEADKSSLELLQQEVCPKTNSVLFVLKDKITDCLSKKRASEISKENKGINRMRQEDAHKVGYAACLESHEKTKNDLKNFISEKEG